MPAGFVAPSSAGRCEDFAAWQERWTGSEGTGSAPNFRTMSSEGRVAASSASAATTATSEEMAKEAMKEVEFLNLRAQQADEERRQCLEVTRSLKGAIRIMGRVRPALQGEECDGSLRVVSKQQLEALIEPRALLTEQLLRHRRRTTGGIGDVRGSKSLSVLSEVDGSMDAGKSQAPLESKMFYFDDLFDSEASDDDIFASVRDELDAAVEGEAVCILAYGATGSGKTHTMANLAERAALELERQAVKLLHGGVKMDITVQIVEIYNDQIRDVLAMEGGMTEPPRLKLSVSSSGAALLGAASRNISTDTGGGIASRLAEALRIGQAQRATSHTVLNGRSSRSHLVMTLFITIRDVASGAVSRSGKLSLVDLAGSERLKRSEAVGERRREAQHINRSLSALADVISAKERRVAHVPYRNSKLTQLLQDALGGVQQCRTVVIVALPPTRDSLSDTMHSLQFSSRLTALSLPTVTSSRRCLRSPDPHGAMRRFPSVPAETSEAREQLLQEVSRWRSQYEKVQAEMDAYRTLLEMKDQELQEEKRRNAELVATTQVASENFERSRAQIVNGFAALNQRIQDVVETSLDGSNRGTEPGSLAGVSSLQQIEPLLEDEEKEAAEISGSPPHRGALLNSPRIHQHPSGCPSLRESAPGFYEFPPTPARAHLTGSAQRTAETNTPWRSPAGLRTSPATPATSTPAWMEQPKQQKTACEGTPSWAGPLSACPKAALAFQLSPPRELHFGEDDAAQAATASSELAAWPASPEVRHTVEPLCSPRHRPGTVSPMPGCGVPVFALSPRAVQPWPAGPRTARGPRSGAGESPHLTEREAAPPQEPAQASTAPGSERSAPITLSGVRPRSTSAHRRANTPREYVVEVISHARARELSGVPLADGQRDDGSQSSRQCPPSPALLLCPGDEYEGSDCTDELVGHGIFYGIPRSGDDGSVSPSSDEGEIRDRLKQSLQLCSNLQLGKGGRSESSREVAAAEQVAARPPPSTSRGPARHAVGVGRQRVGSPGAQTARQSHKPQSPPTLAPRVRVPSPELRLAARSARAELGGGSKSASPPPRVRGAGSGRNGSGSLAAAANGACSSRGGSFVPPSTPQQRRYAPVLSRRSLSQQHGRW
eukprot:TRINITY_DN23135_c0_g1_i2.p1 TRINITY_DN23135_c0_g1~~TRINITY_DN23135_c0_g1_i2.p1  ORF type:complete len:1119 (-),score=209.41 TRINITY_DN23135_c0_g1_i2:61-3417(-)